MYVSHFLYCLHMPSFQLCYTGKIFSESCEIKLVFFFFFIANGGFSYIVDY